MGCVCTDGVIVCLGREGRIGVEGETFCGMVCVCVSECVCVCIRVCVVVRLCVCVCVYARLELQTSISCLETSVLIKSTQVPGLQQQHNNISIEQVWISCVDNLTLSDQS